MGKKKSKGAARNTANPFVPRRPGKNETRPLDSWLEMNARASQTTPTEYHRFDEKDLPQGLKPWPKGHREPSFNADPLSVPDLEKGLYYNMWPDGQLKMIINVENGETQEWLRLANGKAEGAWVSGYVAQKYYSNGQMEDFHPWADSDPPYPADQSFESWVRSFLEGVAKILEKRKNEH